MASVHPKKLQLPKSVLDMKFMKKTKERIEKEIQDTQNHAELYSNIITHEMRSATGNYISESSFIFCEDLVDGRLSFKGMNPEIEKLMDQKTQKHEEPSDDMKKDVSDEILAKKMLAFKNRKRQNDTPSKYVISKKKKRY